MQYYLNEKAMRVLAEAGMPGSFICMDELKNPLNPKVVALVHAELVKLVQVPKPNRKKGSNEMIDVVRYNLSDIEGPRVMPEWQGVNVVPKVDGKLTGLKEDVFTDEPEPGFVPDERDDEIRRLKDEVAGLKSAGETSGDVPPPGDELEDDTRKPPKRPARKTSGAKKSGGSKRKRK